jgi:hypothetical protein
MENVADYAVQIYHRNYIKPVDRYSNKTYHVSAKQKHNREQQKLNEAHEYYRLPYHPHGYRIFQRCSFHPSV